MAFVLTLGLCVAFEQNRPIVTAVVLGGDRVAPALEQGFDLKTSSLDLPEQLDDLVRSLRSRITGMSADQIVIRTADFNRMANNRPAGRHRLMLEGALVFACRESAPGGVYIRTGKEIGEVLGTSKAAAIAAGQRLDSKRADAAAAALSALV